MATGIPRSINKFGQAPAVGIQEPPMWPDPIHYREEPDSVAVRQNQNPYDLQCVMARNFTFSKDAFYITLDSPGVVTVHRVR